MTIFHTILNSIYLLPENNMNMLIKINTELIKYELYMIMYHFDKILIKYFLYIL